MNQSTQNPLVQPEVGQQAPDFTLPDQNGEPVTLSDFQGKQHVVVYFYPKAMTPGCTNQACGIRDSRKAYDEADVQGSMDYVLRAVRVPMAHNLEFLCACRANSVRGLTKSGWGASGGSGG